MVRSLHDMFTPVMKFPRNIQIVRNIRENSDQFLNKMEVLQ